MRQATASPLADVDDHEKLGMCCAKLSLWDEAIQAFSRSAELEMKTGIERDTAKRRVQLQNLARRYSGLAGAYQGKGLPDDQRSALRQESAVNYQLSKLDAGLLFQGGRYQLALPGLKKVADSAEALAEDHDKLAMCYGKLGRWGEAIESYNRSVDLEIAAIPAPCANIVGLMDTPPGQGPLIVAAALLPGTVSLAQERTAGTILNTLEALTCADRPQELLRLLEAIEKKGWQMPSEGTQAARDNALYQGFRAMALRMSGKDASEAESAMRRFTGKPGFKITGWTWDELNQWRKTTKLAPDRKAAVEKIIAELQGSAAPQASAPPGASSVKP
jgi:tetratricopeptide (TPR) repeat protein